MSRRTFQRIAIRVALAALPVRYIDVHAILELPELGACATALRG